MPTPGIKNKTHKFKMGCGNLYITLLLNDNHRPIDIFIHLGKCGCCQGILLKFIEEYVRSMLSRNDFSIDMISNFKETVCPGESAGDPNTRAKSCIDAIYKAMEDAKT